MDIELSREQASQAQVYLRAMAAAVDGVDHANDPEVRRSHWITYCELEGKLHKLIPPYGDAPADPGGGFKQCAQETQRASLMVS
jgi:hypothetical protein